MSGPETTAPRKLPEQWPHMLEMAHEALPEFDGLAEQYRGQRNVPSIMRWDTVPQATLPTLWELGKEMQGLDMKDLDLNRYFAFSLAIRNMAVMLQDPDVREEITEHSASLLLSKSLERNGGISALRYSPMKDAFWPEVDGAYRELSPAVQLLSNFLMVGASQRQRIEFEGEGYPALDDAMLTSQIRTTVISREPVMVQILTTATVSGATAICDRVLLERDPAYDSGGIPSKAARRELRGESIRRVSQAACGLFINEVLYDQNFMVFSDNDVRFVSPRAEAAPDSPSEPGGMVEVVAADEQHRLKYVREEPIICPAAHVGGTVGMALGMVVEAIDRASTTLEERRAG
jgi:hypothetical protein